MKMKKTGRRILAVMIAVGVPLLLGVIGHHVPIDDALCMLLGMCAGGIAVIMWLW